MKKTRGLGVKDKGNEEEIETPERRKNLS